MFVSPSASIKSQAQAQGKSPLTQAETLLERAVGPLRLITPEQRAFSLAVELNDARVAGVALGRIVARQGAAIPLSLKGLWLQVGMALRGGNQRAATALMAQIANY